MPYTEKQHGLFGAALAAKKGRKGVTGAAKKLAKSTSTKELKHMVKSGVKESISAALTTLNVAFDNDKQKIQQFIAEAKVIGFNNACLKFNISAESKVKLVEAFTQSKPQVKINENYNAKYNEYIKRFTVLTEKKKVKQRLDPKCWKGYHKEGTKMKGGKRVNNCVKNRK